MKHAITVNCNSFTYDSSESPVLQNLHFTVDYQKVTLLSGMSGCGKSTLLSLINGIIPRITSGQLDGEILIDEENLSGSSMSQISRKVGSILQNAESQIIHQVVEDEVAFGCENFGVKPNEMETRVSQACHMVKLDRTWKTRTLSGGQKQRVVTASTLVMNTDILIFDEPLANLDQAGALDLLKLLRTLADSGKAILLVEHRLDVVLPFVDEVWQMKDGRTEKITDKYAYLGSQISLIQDKATDNITSADNALQIKQISKRFGNRVILNQVNATIKKGSRILLLGENGCGKSTMLHILARLLKPDSGEVVQQFDLSLKKKADKKWFRAVGVVYQNPNYQLFMPSVEEEISFGAEDKEYALNIAHRFGLDSLLSRHPHSLSEGQKRRVTIASILAQRPQILLLDEPTVGQDYEGLKQMVAVINQIHQEEQNTMITITHDFRCASALCDQALWLEQGTIFRVGGKELVEEFFQRSLPDEQRRR